MKLNSSAFLTMILVDNVVTTAITKVDRSIGKVDKEIIKEMEETQDLDSVAAMFLKRQSLLKSKDKMSNMYKEILGALARYETLHEADFALLASIMELIPNDGEDHKFRPNLDEFDDYLTDIVGEDE